MHLLVPPHPPPVAVDFPLDPFPHLPEAFLEKAGHEGPGGQDPRFGDP
jgi:hypothetical protein